MSSLGLLLVLDYKTGFIQKYCGLDQRQKKKIEAKNTKPLTAADWTPLKI